MDYIAKKIQELRLKHNLSQGDLADRLGVSRQAISKWEREEGLPDLYNIKRLAEIFKVSVDELVTDGGNIIIDYRNKTSVLLLSIPMTLIALGMLVLLFFTIAYGVVITGDIFTLGRMILYNNLQWVYIPVGLLISIVLLESFINLLSNHKVNLSRILTILMYVLVLSASIVVLLAFELSGFSIIFLYIFGFIIVSVGLVGAIIFQSDIRLHTGMKEKKSIKISLRVLKTIMISYIILFSISAIQTYIFTKPLEYLYAYSSESIDDSFHMIVNQDETNTDIKHFIIDINYLVQLESDVQNPYVKIYMLDTIIVEGSLSDYVTEDFNYRFVLNDNDYVLPLILLDYEQSIPIEIKCVVTYSKEGASNTLNIYPEFRNNRTVIGFGKVENMWIWDYKDYIQAQ